MSFHVEDRFTPGPISKVPASWFNNVGRFLNNLVGGLGIRVNRDTTPPQIMLDVEKAKLALAVPSLCANAVVQDDVTGDTTATVAARAPAAVEQAGMDASGDAVAETDAQKIARIGVSHFAAREDHKHRDPVIHQTRQTLDDMFFIDPESEMLCFAPPVFDCGGRFIGLSDDDAYPIDVPLANISTGNASGVICADGRGGTEVKSIGTASGTVAAGDHDHEGVYQRAGTVPSHSHNLTDLSPGINGHSGNCLVVAQGDSITHSGNNMYNAANSLTAALQNVNTSAILTCTHGSGNNSTVVSSQTIDGSANKVLTTTGNGGLEWKSASSLAPSASAVAGELAGDATAISGIAASLAADSAVVGAIAAEVETDVDDEDVAAAVAALVQSSVTPTASDVAAIVADNVEANVTPSTAQVAAAVATEIADDIAENIDAADVESEVVDSIATTLNTQSFQNSVVEAVAEEIDTSNITDQDIISATAALIHNDVTPADIADAVEEALETNNAANAVNALAADYSSGLPYVKRSDIGGGLQVDAQNNNAVSVKLGTNGGLAIDSTNHGLKLAADTANNVSTLTASNLFKLTRASSTSLFYTLSMRPLKFDRNGLFIGVDTSRWSDIGNFYVDQANPSST